MKVAGQYVTVAIIQYAPGSMDAVSQEAETSFRELVRQASGLVEMVIVRTGADSSMVVTTYESREHAEQAAPQGQAWLKEHAGENVRSFTAYRGDVVMIERGS